MTAPSPVAAEQRRHIQSFYERWTLPFLAHYGPTLQAGLVKDGPDGVEDPVRSTRLLAGRAGLRAGERVLDAGCGVGGPARDMAEAIAGLRVDGVTLVPAQAEVASGLFAASPAADRLTVSVADYHCLPFPDGAFDAVVLFETLGYSPDLDALARELFRVVRPGGRVYGKDVFRAEAVTAEQQRQVAEFDELWAMVRSPSIEQVIGALRRAGFVAVGGAELPDVGEDRFRGAMLDFDPADGLRLNELGQHFLRRFSDLALLYGEVRGERP